MKSRTRSLVIVFLSTIILFVSACSNAGSGNESGSATNSSNKENITLNVQLGDWWTPNLEKIAEEYKKENPNVTLKFEAVPIAGYMEKVMTSMVGGNSPDIIDLTPENITSLAARGMLMSWDDHIKDLDVSDFVPAVWKASQLDGVQYGIPNRATNTVLFYNKKMFDDANLPYPTDDWTYDDILENAQKLTHGDQYGFGIAATLNDINNVNMSLAPIIYGFGGQIIDSTNSKFLLNQPKGVEALTYFTELYTKHKVVPEGSLNYSISKDVLQLFINNSVAMMSCSSFCIRKLTDTPDVDYDMVQMPGGITNSGGFSWTIASESKNQEAARDFVLWFSEPENLSRFQVNQPARLSATTSEPWNTDKYKKIISYSDSDKGLPLPSHPKWAEINRIIVVEVQKIMQGEKTPKQGAEDMAKEINPLLSEK